MADGRDDPDIHWVEPKLRGIIPLDGFHLSRSLERSMLRQDYELRVDHDFRAVLHGCADRPETWISRNIEDLYVGLHDLGHAHSVEVWSEGALIGGTYGVALGAGYFGESMFSRRTDASKIALAWLVHRLNAGGFQLFDTQFLTSHLASLGGQEISRKAYQAQLAQAVEGRATFHPAGYAPTAMDVVQLLSHFRTQTS